MSNPLVLSLNSYHGFSTEDALNGAAQAGFRRVELCAVHGWTENVHYDMTDAELGRIRQQLRDLRLEAAALSGHQDIVQREATLTFLRNMELARRLGVPLIVTGVGEVEGEADLGSLRENLGLIARKAEELNLVVGIEVHGHFLSTGVKAKQFLDDLGLPHLGVNYDSGNVVYYGDTPPLEDLPLCVDRFVYFHLKDKIGGKEVWNFPAIGDGELPIADIKTALEQGGYTGPVSVELEFTGEFNETLEEVHQAVARSKKFLESIGWLG